MTYAVFMFIILGGFLLGWSLKPQPRRVVVRRTKVSDDFDRRLRDFERSCWGQVAGLNDRATRVAEERARELSA